MWENMKITFCFTTTEGLNQHWLYIMPTEGHSFKYCMQYGTEQLMVDICGF